MSFTFSHLCTELAAVALRWRAEPGRPLERADVYPFKNVHVDRILPQLFDRNGSGVLAVIVSEQHLTSSKNAMEQEEGKKKEGEKAMQTKWEAQESRSYLISINGVTGDPRDPRKSLR